MSARRRDSYRRGRPHVEPEPAILVVTEGAKTEPIYVESLRRRLRLLATRVEVMPADGTDPGSIIDFAVRMRSQRKREAKKGDSVEYEAVWIVFDSEQKSGTGILRSVLQRAEREHLRVALSSPCFEYWFILHYEFTTQYMCTYKEAERRLKKHVPGYDKSVPPVDSLLSRLGAAMDNAAMCRREQDKSGTELPRTDVDRLVACMNCAAREHHRLLRRDKTAGADCVGCEKGV